MIIKKQKGFTLIELLVVIAIIGILAGILFIAIDPKEQIIKAQAATIFSELKAIETAFVNTAAENGDFNYFPLESSYGQGAKPYISTLISNNLIRHLPENMTTKAITAAGYRYDNDGDIYNYLNSCSGNGYYSGANIIFWFNYSDNSELMDRLDLVADDSDGLTCGKIRYWNNFMIYTLDTNK